MHQVCAIATHDTTFTFVLICTSAVSADVASCVSKDVLVRCMSAFTSVRSFLVLHLAPLELCLSPTVLSYCMHVCVCVCVCVARTDIR